ncbi:hypothetical protein IC235_05685 [Hymenobacter sp. BT664]|uniref:Uncharacterized protein n=1 Tax=Hymenobacter montanus TaxID=2771359 RepID=A0A927GIR0_9BACT|nr:hypothetical protein [Hymenobacter montanus]MBD2767379.1 hypothetical protein [Hymenobacter montanus]
MNSLSQNRGSSRLLIKALLLSLPFLPVLATYIVFDPFRVLYSYQKFDEPFIVIPNRDYISTQMYLNTYKQRPYSSFILGNSRTMSFMIRDWTPYIGDTLAFHYDASGESLYGIWRKLLFLEQHGSTLKNVLLVVDHQLLEKVSDEEGHIFRKDPRTTGEFPLSFQLSFLKAYLSDLFFYKYLRYRITGKFVPEMGDALGNRRIDYDPVTNDLTLPDINAEIKRDSLGFYAHNTRLRGRKPGVAHAVIGAAQLRELIAICNIFKRHRTNFHFVISPLYQQQQLNPADLTILQRTFGANRIHDFSGVNEFTAFVGNYYEESHYRPHVGRQILKRVYAPSINAR